MNVWIAEIGRSWRASLRRPGFLLLAVCVLGLGVGASTTVFTLIDQMLLRPLPFAQPDRLVAMGMDFGGAPVATPPQYQHLKNLQGVVSTGLVRNSSTAVNALGNGVPEQVAALYADRHLLPTLGVHLQLGHNFTAQEDRPHGSPVTILTHGFWERNYGGTADVIGKQLMVKGVPHTIVGVLPVGFDEFCRKYFYGGCDILLPTGLPANSTVEAGMYRAIARMAPGATVDAVSAQVDARMHQLYASSTSDWLKNQKFAVMDLSTALHADSKSLLMLFMASALFVLLIAWVNLTNLLFLRTLSRHHDGAIREALGASTLRRHLPAFAESFLAGILGALLGVALAVVGLSVFRHFAPAAWLAGNGLHIGASDWLFALIAAVLAALSATVLGLWKGSRVDMGVELHEGGRSGASPRLGYLGRVLVVVQVTLATALLSGAGLFLHALVDASQVHLGYNPSGVLTFELKPLKTEYPDAASVLALSQRLRQRLDAQPGIMSADAATALPTGGYSKVGGFQVGDGKEFAPQYAGVDANYFATFSIPVIKGRVFNRMDQRGSESVVVVNQAFARKYFGGDALGKTLKGTRPKPVSLRVIGVVGDTRQAGPLRPSPPIMYVPLQQVPASFLTDWTMLFALRVHGDPDAYRKVVKAAMAEVAPMQAIARVRSLQSMVANTVSQVWLILLLVGLFALLALLLAAAGIYAVMAVVVAAREHEFGVRTALGASPGRLVRLVLRGGMLQIVIGLVLGIGIALLLSSTLHTMLTQIGRSALDPWAIAGVCVLLAVAGLLACLRPALRAGHVQPMQALRGE